MGMVPSVRSELLQCQRQVSGGGFADMLRRQVSGGKYVEPESRFSGSQHGNVGASLGNGASAPLPAGSIAHDADDASNGYARDSDSHSTDVFAGEAEVEDKVSV